MSYDHAWDILVGLEVGFYIGAGAKGGSKNWCVVSRNVLWM